MNISNEKEFAFWLMIGLTLGIGFGLAVDQLAGGVAIGLALGLAIGMMRQRGSEGAEDSEEQ